ncbi:MAG: hypothetical protein KIT20_11015 [Alphaproteobacteria bacterium]|nr:hypothetical protein [Alphaproteobacteria bacterium]
MSRRLDLPAVLVGMAWNTLVVAMLAVAYPLFVPILVGILIHLATVFRIRQKTNATRQAA